MGTEEFEVECFDQIDDGYEEMKHDELVQRLVAEWGETGKQCVDDCFREGFDRGLGTALRMMDAEDSD